MPKRLIDCTARELASYNKAELLQSITESEGRVLATETIGTVTPMLVNITNAEFVTSLGSDLIMLNVFDVQHPVINGLPETVPEDTIREVKRLTGRMVAINLEPAVVQADGEVSVWSLTEGRRATVENAKKAADMGVDMIVLTGNPGVGVDNQAINQALKSLKEAVGDRVILTAGKMHASGILSEAGENIMTEEDAEAFIQAGADVLLLPAPGSEGLNTAKLRVVRGGVLAGSVLKKRFQPAHALFMAYGADCTNREELTLADPRTAAWLRGEEIDAVTAQNGWCAVLVDGFPLGGGKVSGGRIKNHYPKGLRNLQ